MVIKCSAFKVGHRSSRFPHQDNTRAGVPGLHIGRVTCVEAAGRYQCKVPRRRADPSDGMATDAQLAKPGQLTIRVLAEVGWKPRRQQRIGN